MGLYTPAVIVHDLAPPRHEWPDWIRPLSTPSASDHVRLVACDTRPRELTPVGGRVDLGLWRWARRQVLEDVSTAKVTRFCGVGARAVRLTLETLRLERDLYARRRCRR